MDLTWIAIAASLLMGGGGLLVFVWAVRSRQFQSFEDVKFQVFWSDFEQPPANPASTTEDTSAKNSAVKEQGNGSSTKGN